MPGPRSRGKNKSGGASVRHAAFVPALTACLLCLALIPAARVQAATDQAGTFVEKAEADIRINLDGTVDIVESITFHFQHKKTALPFDLIFPLEGEPHLEMLELAREEGADQGKYIPIPRQDKLRPQPLSYSTVRKRDRIRAVVDSTGLQGRCTFRITYQWNRGVILKEGRAIVSGPLLAVRPDTRIETMKWTLHFPEGIRMDLSQITPVSIRAMTMKKTSERTISYIDNQTFYKIDGIALIISMPGNSFPLIFPASDKTSLSSLFEKADRQSWQLSRLGMLRLSLIRVVVPLAAAGLLIYVTLYLIQIMGLGLPGRNFARWPVSEAPALVAKLARIHPRDSLLLLGTLLQLINRKEVLWRDEIFSWRKPGRNDFSGFTAWEIVLLQWLFAGHESYDHTLAPERLRLAARDPDFRELATRFRAQIDKEFNHSGLKNLKLTSSFRLFFIVFAALFFVLSGLLFLITHAATAFLLLIPALFFALGGITFRFLTGKGVRRYLETRRFMRKLASPQMIIDSCAGRLNEAETVISTLPAAIALKKRKAFFKGLRALPRPLFMRASYALLHVYRQLPVPGEDKLATISSDDEFERLRLKIEEMERILSAWEEFFDSCFI